MRVLLLTVAIALSASAEQRYTSSADKTPYSEARGYGYETSDAANTFYFSIRVAEEGNYRVSVTLGDPARASVTTVKAELRRLMLERIPTSAGNLVTRSFLVNVRRPQIPGGAEVKLKERERTAEMWAWDNKLTLEFSGANPSFQTIAVRKVTVPTVYIAGDSTSTDQGSEPFNSWGQMITRFFQPDIAIANHGESGESLRGFIGENRLAKIMSIIQPGDWLLIQMGHNDQKEKGNGVGAFTTYKAGLKQLVSEARAHGATPVLITPMHRLNFDDSGRIVNTLGDYPEAVRQTAAEEKVALLDLNNLSKQFYEALGPAEAPKAFAPGDKTHHNDYGSYELARCLAQAMRDVNLALAKHLLPAPRFDPAHPDPLSSFTLPPDPVRPIQKPYGN